MIEAIVAQWTPCVCPICDGPQERESLGLRLQRLVGGSRSLEMRIEDMLCLSCGFVHARALPDEKSLFAYYRDAHTRFSDYAVIRPDYNVDLRISLIARVVRRKGRILELGAGSGEFCEALCGLGWKAKPVDPLGDNSLPTNEGGFDAVLAYLVLEHVHEPRTFLSRAASLLALDGVLVIEVPDFLRNPVASLQPEHFWHFTPEHLAALLGDLGLSVVESDHGGASRPFAFTVVARRDVRARRIPLPADKVERSRAAYREAERLIRAEDARASRLAGFVRASKPPRTYIWGANEYATRLGYHLAEMGLRDIRIIDSAASKIGTLHDGFATPIEAPVFCGDEPAGCFVLLCSPTWNCEIRQTVETSNLRSPRIVDAVAWRPDAPQ